MAHRYARIDATNTVTQILKVGENTTNVQEWAQVHYKTSDSFVETPHNDAKIGPGFKYENSTFTAPKPYNSWVKDIDANGVEMWVPPVAAPTKLTNDQTEVWENFAPYCAVETFVWDEANVRWLNKQRTQYWDPNTSSYVDI